MAKQGKCTKCKIRYYWSKDRKGVKCPIHHKELKTTSHLSKFKAVEILEANKPSNQEKKQIKKHLEARKKYKPNMKDMRDCKKVQRIDTEMILSKPYFITVYNVQEICPSCQHNNNCIGGTTARACISAIGLINKTVRRF